MNEVLKDVLIKELTPQGIDVVFIVDNLPKSLLYRKGKKMMIDYTDTQNRQLLVPAFEVLDNGRKRQTNELEDQLIPGIEMSDSGDGAYVFNSDLNSSRDALAAIDRYIQMSVPVAERVPERIPYAAQPGNHTSSPRNRNQIPRVVLPELVSPPTVQVAQVPAPRALQEGHVAQAPASRQVAASDRMAKARAAKAAKAKATDTPVEPNR